MYFQWANYNFAHTKISKSYFVGNLNWTWKNSTEVTKNFSSCFDGFYTLSLFLICFLHTTLWISCSFWATEFKSINPAGPLKYIAVFDSQLDVYVSTL